MTHGMSLSRGLLFALSLASPTAVFGTENRALDWGRGEAPPARVAIASAPDATSTAWKSNGQSEAAEIRFKKPATLLFTDLPSEQANGQPASRPEPQRYSETATNDAPPAAVLGAPAVTPLVSDAAASAAAASAPASIPNQALTTVAAATPAPASIPAAAATATPATTAASQAAETPAASAQENVTTAAAIETNEQTTQTAAKPAAPRTDEHVQLVARMFQEDAVGELPPAPGDDEPLPPRRSRNGNNTTTHDDDQDLTADYLGDCYDDTCCPPPAPPLFWVAGVEATFLNPDLNSDGVTFLFEEISEERSDWTSSQSSEIDSIYVAPRIWIGVQGCKWGANLRYWHMNASEGYFDPSIGATGDWDTYDCGVPDLGFISCSRFEAYTVDLEVTRRFCMNDCQMMFSAGLRHAEIEHGESLIGTALGSDATFLGFAAADRSTRGTGVVFGLYGRKPLFPCSCVHWFYNVRWSALWGPTETRVETASTMFSDTGSAGSINGASTCVDDNLFVGEIQLGLEWNYALRCLPANAFFRAAVEYQRWDGGMGYSEAGSFAGIEVDNEFTTVAETFAAAAAPELDLVGITLGTGLTW